MTDALVNNEENVEVDTPPPRHTAQRRETKEVTVKQKTELHRQDILCCGCAAVDSRAGAHQKKYGNNFEGRTKSKR